MISLKRAYEAADKKDGTRFLVDHLWPRGVTKDMLRIESWARDVSPSNELRTWFGHDPAKWKEFQRRYVAELRKKPETWEPLAKAGRKGRITLVYGAKDTAHNNAVALREFLEHEAGGRKKAPKKNAVAKSTRSS